MPYTKGTFKDGSKGWKAVKYENKVGYATHEIHFSDDGECVAEVVHGEDDALLIAAAPDLLEAIQAALRIKDLWSFDQNGIVSLDPTGEMQALKLMEDTFKSAIEKATK